MERTPRELEERGKSLWRTRRSSIGSAWMYLMYSEKLDFFIAFTKPISKTFITTMGQAYLEHRLAERLYSGWGV